MARWRPGGIRRPPPPPPPPAMELDDRQKSRLRGRCWSIDTSPTAAGGSCRSRDLHLLPVLGVHPRIALPPGRVRQFMRPCPVPARRASPAPHDLRRHWDLLPDPGPTKNDQVTIESKNNHLVRRYGFYFRYDTPLELDLLNQLWALANHRRRAPQGPPSPHVTGPVGRRNASPAPPPPRLLTQGSQPSPAHDLAAHKASLRPAEMAKRIHDIQQELTRLAGHKTRYPENKPTPSYPTLRHPPPRARFRGAPCGHGPTFAGT